MAVHAIHKRVTEADSTFFRLPDNLYLASSSGNDFSIEKADSTASSRMQAARPAVSKVFRLIS